MQNTNRIVTLFSTKGFGRDELFGNAIEFQSPQVVSVLSAFSIENSFSQYLQDKVFKSPELENAFCLKLASDPEAIKETGRHISSLKNNNTAIKRNSFFNRFIVGNDAVKSEILSEGVKLFKLPGVPDIYGVECLTQSDTSDLWIPTLLRCVWALCKDVTRIQLVLHDKDVPEWKRIHLDDVTVLLPEDYPHYIFESAFNGDDDSKQLFKKISNNEIEIRIVFFHHTTNVIANIVGNIPPKDGDINTLVQTFIDSQFEAMKNDVQCMDQALMQ